MTIALDYAPADARANSLARSMMIVGWGIFASTITQTYPLQLGDQVIRAVLQKEVGTVRTATFFAVAMAPWYMKPIAGLLSDAFPLLGTRRKGYMVLGSAAAGLLWLLLGAVPHTYAPMLVTAVLMNCGLVLLSSATAGLLVEDGQRLGATGRLTAARLLVMSAASIMGSLLGGFLAQRGWFRAAAAVSAAVLFSTVPIVWLFMAEPKRDVPAGGALRSGWEQIKLAVSCGTLWAGAGMSFLIHVSPGFASPLYDHLTADLGFSKQFIGVMQSVGGGGGFAAALAYAWLCRRLRLRTLLVIGVSCAAVGVLPFLGLRSRTGGVVAYASWGFSAVLAQLAALDLATRAAPRGVEAMGYALMVSAYNISFNAGTTLLVLIAIPFLPGGLLGNREGGPSAKRCRSAPSARR
jgi:MFS family permease